MIFLTKNQVMARTGLSLGTILRQIKAGAFPAAYKFTPRRLGWLESEIEAWELSRPQKLAIRPDNLKK